MATLRRRLLLFLLLLFSLSSTLAQQPYEVNNPQLDCYTSSNTTSVLGYTCNAAPSCPTFFTFRSQPPYQTPSAISALLTSSAPNVSALNAAPSPASPFPVNDLVLVPATCSCVNSSLYQHTAHYTLISADENYLLVANDTYQGLSTCQALIAQNTFDSRHLKVGDRLTVPLRCACPTSNQTRNGTKYLLSYVITWGDDVPTIAQRFNSNFQEVLDANSLSYDEVIYPFTTLLVPIKTVPIKDQLLTPPPPKPGDAAPPPADDGTGGGSGKKWVFVGVGIGAGVVVLLGAAIAWYYFCCFRRRERKLLDEMPVQQGRKADASSSAEYGALSGKASTDPFVSSEIRGLVGELTVYKFGDLETAAGSFGEDHRIKGAVYRAVINGDDAAIKRLKGDVTSEINILKRINHSNVVRLSGFCVHEGSTYLVYEFAGKGSLADWLHRNKDSSESLLTWKHRVRVAYDVADGLNYLHNYTNPPYIHKNLKSSNILLDGEFRAKLANFGLARPMVDDDEGPQLTRHVVGTQGYMAPEYLEHGLITPKLDVFAFGVIVLELLSGKEATFVKEGEEKGEVLLWASIQKVMSGDDVRAKLKDFIDPCLRDEYPFDLAFAMAELATRCVVADPGSRPAMTEVMMSLSAIYNSSLDYDPSDVGNTNSMIRGSNEKGNKAESCRHVSQSIGKSCFFAGFSSNLVDIGPCTLAVQKTVLFLLSYRDVAL